MAMFLTGGVILTLAAWRGAYNHEQRVEFTRHAALVEQAASGMFMALEREASAEISAVPAVVSLYDSSDVVDPDEFATFTADALDRFDGLLALEFAPRVDRAEVDAFLALAADNGVDLDSITTRDSDGTTRPALLGPVAWPVLFAEPRAARDVDIGLDLGSASATAAVVAESIEAGALRVSQPSRFDAGISDADQLIAAAPVFTHNGGHTLRGVVIGVYDLHRLAEAALTDDPHVSLTEGGVDLFVYASEGPPDRLPVHAHPAMGLGEIDRPPFDVVQDALHAVHRLEVGGTSLLTVARPRVLRPSTRPGLFSWTVLLAGLALTSTLGGIFQALAGRNRIIAELVDARTAELASATRELAQREAHLRTILDTTLDGIITIDHTGQILTVNAAMERLFGFTADELVGEHVTRLMPDHAAAVHSQGFDEHMRGQRARIVGSTREVQGRRRDGSLFDAELSISELRNDGPPRFLGVVRDISERKEVDKLKDRFISTVSHELRTPLTSVLGSLELLRDGAVGRLPPQAARMVALAYDSGERLVRLINDILDIERLGTGRMDLHKTDFDGAALLAHTAAVNHGLASAHDVHIVVDAPDSDVPVHADRDRLIQVLTNLVGNAARFSPPGGTVRLGVQRRGAGAVFSVRDDGPGIPLDFRPMLFAPFSQADASDTRRLGGTGLGLSIAKAIIEEHGGQIWYNTEEGRGTTFFFSVPGATGPAPGPRP